MSQTPSAPFSEDRASQVAAGISLVGALLIALAFPLAARLRTTEVPRWLAVAAVALAVLTVLAGLGAVVLGLRRTAGSVRLQTLLAMVAGVLLMAETVLTGSAAAAWLAGEPARAPAARESLTVVLSGLGDQAQLPLRAEMPDVAAGELVRAEVIALPGGDDPQVLARQLTMARNDGPVSVALAAASVGGYDSVRVLVESPHRRCTADVRPLISEAPFASCKAR
jgi:hypothetical protein